jgi:ubiquinone/menaquinone biosynthesis C-methylase UbiE
VNGEQFYAALPKGSYTGAVLAGSQDGANPVSPPGAADTGVREIERIRREYATRSREIPAGFYDWHRTENQFLHAGAARACSRLLSQAGAFPLDRAHILDVGCGRGQWLLEFLQWGATVVQVHGIDLLPDRIVHARERLAGAELRCGDARRLPWPDASFDLVSQFTMFSSILDPAVRDEVANEMRRVLRPGGRMLWYDLRRSNPIRSVHGLSRHDVRMLFPGCAFRFLNTTLAPPLARIVARRSWTAAFALESLPLATTHLAAVITVS